jgi:hypothetical protein
VNKEELSIVIEKHKLWFNDEKGGERAYLSRADLTRADLSRADLREADLREADLTGAYLSRADLTRADLSRADLRKAYLSGAYLREADLREADLTGAYLTGAYLSRADLSGADLTGADLSGADLREADLTGAKIHRNYTIKGKLYQLTNVGSENGNLFIADCEEGWYFNRGCFRGGKDEFLEAVKKTHGKNKHAKFYKKIVKLYTEVSE